MMITFNAKSHCNNLCPDEKSNFKCNPSITPIAIKEYMAGYVIKALLNSPFKR